MLATIFIILTVVLIAFTFVTNLDEPSKFESYPQISEIGLWSYVYSTQPISSDVYTTGAIGLAIITKNNPIRIGLIRDSYSVFTDDCDILPLLKGNLTPVNKDMVVNWGLPQLSVSNKDWVTLIPWRVYKQEIIYNSNYNIVCSSGVIDYLVPS